MTDWKKRVLRNGGRSLCLLLSLAVCGQSSGGQSRSAKPKIVLAQFALLVDCKDLKDCKELSNLGVDDPSRVLQLLSFFTDKVLEQAQVYAKRGGRPLNIDETEMDFNTAKASLAKSRHGPEPSPWIIQAVIVPLGPSEGYAIRLRTQRATDKDIWRYPHPCSSTAQRLRDVVQGEAVKVGSELAELGKDILDNQSDGQ